MLELPRTRRWAAWERIAAWHVFVIAFTMVAVGLLVLFHRGRFIDLGQADLFASLMAAAVITARWRVLYEP
jgi:hypothetical protein